MTWILLIAWAATGTGYTAAEFDSKTACQVAAAWVREANTRGGAVMTVCLNKISGRIIGEKED
jgi:hypothetical protein